MSRVKFLGHLLLLAGLLLSSQSCLADVLDLGLMNAGFQPYGIDNSGHVVVTDVLCNAYGGVCYYTYTFTGDTVGTPVITASAPALDYVTASNCSAPIPSGFTATGSACQDGQYVYGGSANDGSARGLWYGPDPTVQSSLLMPSLISMDANGDFLFEDEMGDQIDLWTNNIPPVSEFSASTTPDVPEPSSFVLTLSACGLVVIGLAVRRRRYLAAAPPNPYYRHAS